MTSCRLGFLFNHDQIHQVAHSLPIALALAEQGWPGQIVIATTNQRLAAEVRRLGGAAIGTTIDHVELQLSPLSHALRQRRWMGNTFREITDIPRQSCFLSRAGCPGGCRKDLAAAQDALRARRAQDHTHPPWGRRPGDRVRPGRRGFRSRALLGAADPRPADCRYRPGARAHQHRRLPEVRSYPAPPYPHDRADCVCSTTRIPLRTCPPGIATETRCWSILLRRIASILSSHRM